MQKDTNQQETARAVLAEHRDRLECALIECTLLERAHNEEIAIAGERGPYVTLAALRTTLRHALADCDQLAALLQDDERDASTTTAHDLSGPRDTVRATFGDYTVEIKAPGMGRPLASWIGWLHNARRAAESLFNPSGE
ncbi:MAG TPA: hypothetical protein VH143_21390 [Kofleriaceae bacterium]|jgi:hypothetical protein|nr:hypothetical protein [Kofleriaceae bacterium]